MLVRARRVVPVALAAGASAVMLATSPASAATITQINVSTSAIPRGANCVYISAESSGGGRISPAFSFTAGGSFQTGGFHVNTGDTVRFEWHSNNCGPRSTLATRSYTAPNSTTWNIT
ncbi:hypothetical protein ABZX85_38420 [Streptomyces sp. NPDC004539]|uniref:hypothetical protein n=1 Tax=Streptomyces sp. NPDC004539 TaxID=3154280 RepID=UPI0033A200D4